MRPAQVLISRSALRANFAQVKCLAPQSMVAAVVKANAYGHGAITCALTLDEDVDAFAVACSEEALTLREAGVSSPIILLEGQFSAAELSQAAAKDFWPMLHSAEQVEQLLQAPVQQALTVWLKVDTGMHRLGCELAEASTLFRKLQQSEFVREDIILATHFACADSETGTETFQQMALLDEINRSLQAPLSLANSAAIVAHPDTHRHWVRPGIMLYGSNPLEYPHSAVEKLQAVMTLQSEVIAVRKVRAGDCVGYGHSWRAAEDSIIATAAIGYGDGYPRAAPSGTPVLVGGQRGRLCGRVSMDLISIDVTGLDNVRPGSMVQCWGPDLSVDEVARCAGTIGYELLTRMPPRASVQVL